MSRGINLTAEEKRYIQKHRWDKSPKDIADELGRCPSTISMYMKRLKKG